MHQSAGARLLRSFFGQQAGELQRGIGLSHVQPRPALLARLVHCVGLDAVLFRERLQQQLIHRLADHQHTRHGNADVMLRQKGLQNPPLHAARASGIGVFDL